MYVRTAEFVSPAHPDKVCDQISDAILDYYLAQDKKSRVAVETCGGHGKIWITGEVTSLGSSEGVENVVRSVLKDNAYADCDIALHLVAQSPEIAQGVDIGGAGDQGIMVGYATAESDDYMPLEYHFSRAIMQHLIATYGIRDAKAQVTIIKDDSGFRITDVVASVQGIRKENIEHTIRSFLTGEYILHVNPAGDWDMGGFDADAGLTGRKIVNDAYGPRVPVGGGAFSGKDPTKVDRSAAYMARKIAVDYIHAGAKEALIKIAYAIGEVQPIMVQATIDGQMRDEKKHILEKYDLSPQAIISFLHLLDTKYYPLSKRGHFGHAGNIWDN